MTTRKITCREHGGTFSVPAQRGRPPVRCNPEKGYQCTKLRPATKTIDGEWVPDFANMSNAELKAYAREHFSTITKARSRVELIRAMQAQLAKMAKQPVETVAEPKDPRNASLALAQEGDFLEPLGDKPVRVTKPRAPRNASLSLAQEAKTLLEAQGWSCAGKAWTGTGVRDDEREAPCASLVGSRGEEMITLLWINGVLTDQKYSLWNVNRPSMNGKPASKLPFDPEEVSDSQLARLLSGMRVVWWNRIGKNEETAVIPDNKITIQHMFNGTGDETPGERVITFVDLNGRGFRAFRLDALMRVGGKL